MPDNVGQALTDTLRIPELKRKVATQLSAVRKGIADSGALKEIPAFKCLAMIHNGLSSYRDQLLVQKLLRFFYQLRDIPVQERETFSAQLDQDPAKRDRIGEQLFLLIDRHDDIDKPSLLGLVWREYLRGKVTLYQFERIARAIDRVHLPHIVHVSSLGMSASNSSGEEAAILTDLLQAGLAYPASVGDQLLAHLGPHPSAEYLPTDIAHILLDLYEELQGQSPP